MCADTVLNTTPDFTSSHVFSTNDLTGGFDGLRQADLAPGDTTLIDFTFASPKNADGTLLYPVNTDFGFVVSDFENAFSKTRTDNPEYEEGWVGDLKGDGDVQSGIVVSDAPTDTFKTPAVFGTWLSGLGGNSVKASTEHYVVMQNVLSDAMFPEDPGALYPLDDNLMIIGGQYDGQFAADVLPIVGDVNGDGEVNLVDVLDPNETEIDRNIAVSTDYSVTLKDDGKLLYRWGNMIKKPNDVRLDIKLALPDEFEEIDAGSGLTKLFKITAAELSTDHTVTNNPNDQIRPEDLENEAATGQKPGYIVIPDYTADGGAAREVWVSDGDFYAGDGTFYPAGTILRDDALIDAVQGTLLDDIGALSSDLVGGFTNAWYTTMDREPFEPVLNDAGDDYIVGARWRLEPNKYGQDLPGVEIPLDPSLPPPPTKDQIKYNVGDDTTTVINLLDWKTTVSPLSLSAGYHHNSGTVSGNGVNMTNDLDVAFYVKGDIKPATLYDTSVYMDYEEVTINDAGVAVTGADDVDDYLVGQGGNTFTGGTGNDLFVLSYGGDGNWTALTASTVNDFTIGEDMLALIDLNLDAETADDFVTQTVGAGGLTLSMGGTDLVTLAGVTEEIDLEESLILIDRFGDETVLGTMGDDFLMGDAQDNTIFGLAGNDTAHGLEGDDTLAGHSGEDLIYANQGDDVIRGGDQDDVIFAGLGNDYVKGGRGRDTIHLGDGNDTFEDIAQFDAWGADTVYGGRGFDTFLGAGGADIYDGGDGQDSLSGGIGDDSLTGGADADMFRFTAGAGHGNDTITDFELGLDLMEITGAVFADLTISDTSGDALVAWADGSVTLTGVLDTDLGTSDFVFV